MGTPQYMSPEQARGMVADLDVRSDIYILTLRPPIEGKTLNEVLTKVKSGGISSMITLRGGSTPAHVGSLAAIERQIPEALQAVTLKAMALDREARYGSVEAFAADVEAYQNGFATSAEGAGVWKQAKLWIQRNKVLAGAAAVLTVVVTGFTARVVQKGREASEAVTRLRDMAPMAASKAKEETEAGNFEEALRVVSYAVELQLNNKAFRMQRASVPEFAASHFIYARQTILGGHPSENRRGRLEK